jgi:hypothetical protein
MISNKPTPGKVQKGGIFCIKPTVKTDPWAVDQWVIYPWAVYPWAEWTKVLLESR